MELIIENQVMNFELMKLVIIENNLENIFSKNKKTLKYFLEKAVNNKKNRLHKIAGQQLEKYSSYLNLSIGEFLFKLKSVNNLDYKLYLNKYGDEKFCRYKIEGFLNDKGIYCYVVDNEIKYIGRSKKTFKERFNEYGKITPYNCLIDGQSTNCRVNAKINSLKKNEVYVGIFKMTNSSNEQIKDLETKILSLGNFEWNIQKS
jgi:hypothetical protein